MATLDSSWSVKPTLPSHKLDVLAQRQFAPDPRSSRNKLESIRQSKTEE
jgi:hypothetical protein